MKRSWQVFSNGCLIAVPVLYVLSCFAPAAQGSLWPYYLVLTLSLSIPIVCTAGWRRVVGVLLAVLLLFTAYMDYRFGIAERMRMDEKWGREAEQAGTL